MAMTPEERKAKRLRESTKFFIISRVLNGLRGGFTDEAAASSVGWSVEQVRQVASEYSHLLYKDKPVKSSDVRAANRILARRGKEGKTLAKAIAKARDKTVAAFRATERLLSATADSRVQDSVVFLQRATEELMSYEQDTTRDSEGVEQADTALTGV